MAKGKLHGAIPQALTFRWGEPVQAGTVFLEDKRSPGLSLGNGGFAGLHGLFIALASNRVKLWASSRTSGEAVPQNGQTSDCLAGFHSAAAPHAGQRIFVGL